MQLAAALRALRALPYAATSELCVSSHNVRTRHDLLTSTPSINRIYIYIYISTQNMHTTQCFLKTSTQSMFPLKISILVNVTSQNINKVSYLHFKHAHIQLSSLKTPTQLNVSTENINTVECVHSEHQWSQWFYSNHQYSSMCPIKTSIEFNVSTQNMNTTQCLHDLKRSLTLGWACVCDCDWNCCFCCCC